MLRVIGNLIELCARHRGMVLLLYCMLALLAVRSARQVPLDAIPDLSETQVIVFTEWRGRSPTLVEDQITYPITSALLAAPKVEAVRGYSMFGMSFVYVIFADDVDVYWARSRVQEYMSGIQSRLPEAVTPTLGPDATGIGWIYEYALVDRSGHHDLAELRSIQDFSLRYALESVPGVAQVASVGGFEKQYQVQLDPDRLRAFGLSVADVGDVIRRGNAEVGGRVLELGGREAFIRGRGYLRGEADLADLVVKTGPGGTPVRIADVGTVRLGPELRRGLAELDGQGEVVGAIVIARYDTDVLDVIERVKSRLAALDAGLPEGVEVVPTYDRSALIHRAVDTLQHALLEEGVVVALVILLFLMHLRSALLPILSLPLAVLLAFIPMAWFGIPATIMSLGGIAIAVGATVDAEIVMIEACHKRLESAPPDLSSKERRRLLGEAAREVTPAIFFSLLIIAVAFIPVFGLEGQAGRLFKPLAYTKTFVMLSAALLSVTFAPALRDLLIRGKIRRESEHPVSRLIRAVYEPFVYIALRRPITTLAIGVLAVASSIPVWLRLGSEFMPALNEGDILYMPTTLPGLSIEEAKRQLARQDAIIAAFPEVERVFGKVGRAETPTDPAPLSMVETLIMLKPPEQWPTVELSRWHSGWAPDFLHAPLSYFWPESRPESWDELVAKLGASLQLPGWTGAYTMPIRARVDMLTTGVRTPVGVKVFGPDLPEVERVGLQVESILRDIPGTRSILYERSLGGVYVDIVPRRDALARHDLRPQDLTDLVEGAVGGETITTTVEGRRRFSVQVRLNEDARSSPERLRELPVPLPTPPGAIGRAIPLGELADITLADGPPMLRSEAGLLVGYVYIDLEPWRDLGGYVDEAKQRIEAAEHRAELLLGPGMYLRWTGQYEEMDAMQAQMRVLVPLALLLIALLLYMQFRNLTEVLIVLLSIPFALVGSAWMLYLLDYRLSTAVWVGVIALVGLAAQTGVVMIVYIDHAFERRLRAGKIRDRSDIIWAHMEGTVLRVRPKLMTVSTMLIGLTPLLWATGSGADVMKRIAAPMIGGLLSSAFLTLELIPVVYTYWRVAQLKRSQRTGRPPRRGLRPRPALRARPSADPAALHAASDRSRRRSSRRSRQPASARRRPARRLSPWSGPARPCPASRRNAPRRPHPLIQAPTTFATVCAVSIAVMDGARAGPGRAHAPFSASLTDETIRRVRMGVLLGTGLGAAIVGMVLVFTASSGSASWERVNGLAYLLTSATCLLGLVLTRISLLKASELTLLFAAYFGTASVIVTGAADSAIIVGLAAYSLVVLLPGIAIRTRSGGWVWLNLLGVCTIYVASVLCRLALHTSQELRAGDIAIRLLIPPVAFCVQVLMARALNLRILEALEESERSRSALAVSNQLLEKANHNLESARVEAVRARDDAEAANRAKSTFLANMSHELRTPLNSVIGYTEMIIDEARDSETKRIREVMPDLRNVVLSARHLLGLIGGILDLSRIEAGRMDLFQERFDVADFIRELEHTIAPQVRKRGNTLTARTSEGTSSVVADRGKLKQVLLNLLGNACKFTTNGNIFLTATYNPEQSLLVFEVRDDGIGIEADKLAVIFEKFTQLDPSPTRRYEGAGLGLAITRELCARMGASVDVTSEPGSGACFTVSLPILITAPAASSSSSLML